MFSFKKKSTRVPRGKPGERAYAIGDIHGCLAEARALLELIEADNQSRERRPTHVIFLGDLIDRGPDSKGVIELLMEFPLFVRQTSFRLR